LTSFNFNLEVASAQVKSALLLAGLLCEGESQLTGKIKTRDHTERLLPYYGASLQVEEDHISIQGGKPLHGVQVQVPGDPSSAAFWMAAASLLPGSKVWLQSISLNATRTGFLEALLKMGALIEKQTRVDTPEPCGDIVVQSGALKGISISPEQVPSIIDELPLLAVLGAFAQGITEVRGAEELRVKETDRIEAVAANIRRMGGQIETFKDGFRIQGPQVLHGAFLESFDDHRIAMAFSIAALKAVGPTEINEAQCVAISYPDFFDNLERLVHG
jgi:3-phosphoshikimate 1-carboxyvinyltransferase